MAITWRQLAQSVLTGTPANLYQPAASTSTTITAATAWNPTGSPVTVDCYIAPNGGSATDGTHVGRVVVPATKTAPIYDLINHKLYNQEILFASGNGVTITVSGAENV